MVEAMSLRENEVLTILPQHAALFDFREPEIFAMINGQRNRLK